MSSIGGELSFFSRNQPGKFGAHRSEAQFAVKPKRARLDGLVVIETELIRIDRNAFHAGDLMQQLQHLRVHPRGLALSKRVKRVEADLHPLTDCDAFDVVDWNAIL